MFLKDSVVLKRTFKCFTAVVLKRTDWRHGSGSTAPAVWCRLTAEETEAVLAEADVLAAQWWLEKRRCTCVVTGQVVKATAVCQSVGSSSLTVNSQRSLRVLICCIDFLHL